MKLTPGGADTGNGFAVGGGNFRQSMVTIDGASFNNAFGIGYGLPGGGAPISIDAVEQLTVSTSPFDVRQSGFTGGAINAVTKSGTNQFKGSAYMYTTNVHLQGNQVSDYDELPREREHNTMYGLTLGGPIVKDKLFFFVNAEYESNVKAGPTARARAEGSTWDVNDNINHRPTASEMNTISNYLKSTYGYDPGPYEGYSDDAPSYKLLARLDWNVDEFNKVNFRFSKSKKTEISAPNTSVSPLTASIVYPGSTTQGIRASQNLGSNAALYFQSQRYSKEYNFTSAAFEWNSRWGIFNNMVRGTYSYQDDVRSTEGGTFPSTHILKDGAVFAAFGPDIYTAGNLVRVKTFVGTDELSFNAGIHKFVAGLQYESNKAENGFMRAGNGMFIYNSWDDFVNKATPSAYLLTMSAAADGSQFISEMKTEQFSAYLQDQINVSDRFRMTAGLRVEKPIYPALVNNYNHQFAELIFDNNKYSTDQLPDASITLSPRVGFNWDISGDQRYVLRGGTGYFVGRLPFVWLISAVSNSNCGQIQYSYMQTTDPDGKNYAFAGIPTFAPSVPDQLATVDVSKIGGYNPSAPTTPTIIDTALRMNSTWKTFLAFDAKLPYDIDFSLEGMYNHDFNPAVVKNLNLRALGNQTITIAPGDERRQYTSFNSVTPCFITNAGDKAYYYSITASLAKRFDFGLDVKASYTHAKARTYGDGIGEQVTSAYAENRFSVNAVNDCELGYGTYVAPHRVLVSANYRKEYARNFATTVGLLYEGMNNGYIAGTTYHYARYSYTLSRNVVGDQASYNLMYVPESRAALDQWNFTDITETSGSVYSADQQRDDFWSFIQQDSYLKSRTGKYTERGGAIMPWHHQLDLKLLQEFYMKVGGKRNTLQLGVDIKNLPNLINKNWGLYKQVNTIFPLTYNSNGSFNFIKQGSEVLRNSYSDYASFASTYQVLFSLRYIFN